MLNSKSILQDVEWTIINSNLVLIVIYIYVFYGANDKI